MPLTEDSELRTKLQTYPREQMEMIRKMVPWADDSYDKIPVECAIMGDSGLPGTVLRLPMIYGPGDYARDRGKRRGLEIEARLSRLDGKEHVGDPEHAALGIHDCLVGAARLC